MRTLRQPQGAVCPADRWRRVGWSGRGVRGCRDRHDFVAALAAELLKLFQHCVDARRVACFDRLQQRDFNQDSLRRRVAQSSFTIGQDLHDPCQYFGTGALGLFSQRCSLGFRNFQQAPVALRNLINQEIAEMTQQIG